MLNKKHAFFKMKIEQELATAKMNATNNKRVYIEALARKNRYKKELQKIDGYLSIIKKQREALELVSRP